jgi:hypothetical protein
MPGAINAWNWRNHISICNSGLIINLVQQTNLIMNVLLSDYIKGLWITTTNCKDGRKVFFPLYIYWIILFVNSN